MNKEELQVAALQNGTVIDHIPTDKLFTIVSLLGLKNSDLNITIGNNLPSKKLGKKGIIKVADRFFTDEEISRLSGNGIPAIRPDERERGRRSRLWRTARKPPFSQE